jgi:alkanesulfonate monooxygenase SsuD/methylene tetrahydromethanopterin reductase-like flavin-dependent oxidoreductase (luciferase family)
MASVTSRIRIGPMVTPLARRRPAKVARETASLDILSGGRLTLGVGIGSDEFGQEPQPSNCPTPRSLGLPNGLHR